MGRIQTAHLMQCKFAIYAGMIRYNCHARKINEEEKII